MLAIIGNSPSSGSTLLADLLDSTYHSACGVELYCFANKNIYDFSYYRNHIKRSSITPSLCALRNTTNFHRLHSYGLNTTEFIHMVRNSKDLREFADKFASDFLALRGKDKNGVVFEKSPGNISFIDQFIKHFPDSYFIHIVRNPIFVYTSLLRRKFPNYIALLTWFVDVASYLKHKDKKNIIVVNYEVLVKKPFSIVNDILQKVLHVNVSEEDIEKGYRENSYRKIHSKKKMPWSVCKTGEVENANKKEIPREALAQISRLFNVKISKDYAKKFHLPEISFVDALNEFNYYDDIMTRLETSGLKKNPKLPQKTFEDYLRLGAKWAFDFAHREASLAEMRLYLNPIERV